VSYTVTQFAARSAGPGPRIEIEVLAREAGLHPEVVLRLIRLGALDVPIPRDGAARLARVSRLRRDLGLSYNGAILATQLLARIDELEERLRLYEPRTNSNER
jgi:chaperone modulatory protein CbpM